MALRWLAGKPKNQISQGTSVLELTYRDSDKDLVLPVIQKISEAYQEYSGRDRERGIKQGIQYLDQQVEIFAKKVSDPSAQPRNMASNKT